MKIIDERETQKTISVEIMKIIDERETQKKQRPKRTRKDRSFSERVRAVFSN